MAITADPPELDFDLVVDAIFGFGFRPPSKAPFAAILQTLSMSDVPIVSVDVPSGWDVDQGPVGTCHINPKVLVSLPPPQLCARHFFGDRHYVGGRFVPAALARKHNIQIPYKGSSQIVRL